MVYVRVIETVYNLTCELLHRHTDGELFSTVAKTLDECRRRRDEWVAGTTGKNKRLEAIRIDTRKLKNVKLKVIAHIQDIGDVDYGYIDHNTIIGTVGKGKRLEAIHIISEGLDKKKIYIQAHYANDGWGKTVQGNAGSYGLAKAMQANLLLAL